MVGVTHDDVEQAALAGCLEVRDACLDQVAGAVELVCVSQVGPAPSWFDDGEVGVEIAVVVLGIRQQLDRLVDLLLELLVRYSGQAVARGFEPFRHVAVPKDMWLRFGTRPPIQPERVETTGVT
jgi:hypothetical protein